MNNLVYHAYDSLLTQEIHQISTSQLAKDVGFDSKNTKFLKDQIRQLIEITVEWNVLKNGNEVWRASSMLAEAEIDGGIIKYSFPPMLRKMLYDPKVFSVINLHIQKRFNSGYAYSLYENVYRYKNVGSTGMLELETWKKLLGVDENSDVYKEYKHFNNQILKPAIVEVNEVTDIEITPEFKTLGRKVIGIKFMIKVKEDNKSDFEFPSEEQAKIEVLRRILDLGVKDKAAYEYFEKYPLDYISGNLTEVEKRIKEKPGHIKNYGLYFKMALEEDFRKNTPNIDKIHAEKDLAIKQVKMIKDAAEQEAAEKIKLNLRRVRDYYQNQPVVRQKALVEKFSIHLFENNKIVHALYVKNGTDSKMVQSELDHWLLNFANLS